MSYGKYHYGTLLFAAEPEDTEPQPEDGLDLMQYLPDYYRGVKEMESLQDTLGREILALRSGAVVVLAQAYVETATQSLGRWEEELGLSTDPSKSPESRREIIKAKRRGAGTTTPQMIERVASAFTGGEVVVEEVPGEYRFIVRFVGTLGIPPNMAGLIQILEETKPAHLGYEFLYTYTFWDSLKTLTWNGAYGKTWNELRVYG